eukprot:3833958-Amphidinium_carterae.1
MKKNVGPWQPWPNENSRRPSFQDSGQSQQERALGTKANACLETVRSYKRDSSDPTMGSLIYKTGQK